MMRKITLKEKAPFKTTIIDHINIYAMEHGYSKRDGSFYKDGRYYGSFITLGKKAGLIEA